MLRFLTAGDSHGPALVGVLEGLPAHLKLDLDAVNAMLRRRQGGYGRGKRMQMETDRLRVLSGLWPGRSWKPFNGLTVTRRPMNRR